MEENQPSGDALTLPEKAVILDLIDSQAFYYMTKYRTLHNRWFWVTIVGTFFGFGLPLLIFWLIKTIYNRTKLHEKFDAAASAKYRVLNDMDISKDMATLSE